MRCDQYKSLSLSYSILTCNDGKLYPFSLQGQFLHLRYALSSVAMLGTFSREFFLLHFVFSTFCFYLIPSSKASLISSPTVQKKKGNLS